MWSIAHDSLDDARRAAGAEPLTVDQQLKVAEIQALLSISQELSQIHHEGINPEYRQNSD